MIPKLLPPSIECSLAYHLTMTGATTGGSGFRRWSRPSRIETAKRASTMIAIAVES